MRRRPLLLLALPFLALALAATFGQGQFGLTFDDNSVDVWAGGATCATASFCFDVSVPEAIFAGPLTIAAADPASGVNVVEISDNTGEPSAPSGDSVKIFPYSTDWENQLYIKGKNDSDPRQVQAGEECSRFTILKDMVGGAAWPNDILMGRLPADIQVIRADCFVIGTSTPVMTFSLKRCTIDQTCAGIGSTWGTGIACDADGFNIGAIQGDVTLGVGEKYWMQGSAWSETSGDVDVLVLEICYIKTSVAIR